MTESTWSRSGNVNRDLAIFKYNGKQSYIMGQKQVAFEKTNHPTRREISHKWAKRLGEHQELPVPISIMWLRW